jgi:hypothetical protein
VLGLSPMSSVDEKLMPIYKGREQERGE